MCGPCLTVSARRLLRERVEHLRPGDRCGLAARPRARERGRYLRAQGHAIGKYIYRFSVPYVVFSLVRIVIALILNKFLIKSCAPIK